MPVDEGSFHRVGKSSPIEDRSGAISPVRPGVVFGRAPRSRAGHVPRDRRHGRAGGRGARRDRLDRARGARREDARASARRHAAAARHSSSARSSTCLACAGAGPFTRALAGRAHALSLRASSTLPLLLLRRGFWGLRTLVFLGYYARPEAAAEIGYRADAPRAGRRAAHDRRRTTTSSSSAPAPAGARWRRSCARCPSRACRILVARAGRRASPTHEFTGREVRHGRARSTRMAAASSPPTAR